MTAEPKPEPLQEPLFSPIGSSPDGDFDVDPPVPVQPPKRKGGRKPIYATSEERKQRNRQAQAAFRERRTEYIKHLEVTIKQHEDALQSLQQAQHDTATECSRLRYKTSMLERILMEKGYDVESELRSKAVSPISRPEDLSSMPGHPNMWQQTGLDQSNQSKIRSPDMAIKGRPGLEVTEAQLAHLSFNNNQARSYAKQNARNQQRPPPVQTNFAGDDVGEDQMPGIPDGIQSNRQSWPQGPQQRGAQGHPVSISLDLGISPTFSPDFQGQPSYSQSSMFTSRRSFAAHSPTTSLGQERSPQLASTMKQPRPTRPTRPSSVHYQQSHAPVYRVQHAAAAARNGSLNSSPDSLGDLEFYDQHAQAMNHDTDADSMNLTSHLNFQGPMAFETSPRRE